MKEPSRRSLLGALAVAPLASVAAAIPMPANRHEELFAELDAIDAATAHFNANLVSQDEWDAWKDWTDRVWKRVESLPATPENAKLKARAIWSIVNGEPTDINEGQSTVCRLVQHLVAGMNGEGR